MFLANNTKVSLVNSIHEPSKTALRGTIVGHSVVSFPNGSTDLLYVVQLTVGQYLQNPGEVFDPCFVSMIVAHPDNVIEGWE